MPKKDAIRLNLWLQPETDRKIRRLADITGLKLNGLIDDLIDVCGDDYLRQRAEKILHETVQDSTPRHAD